MHEEPDPVEATLATYEAAAVRYRDQWRAIPPPLLAYLRRLADLVGPGGRVLGPSWTGGFWPSRRGG